MSVKSTITPFLDTVATEVELGEGTNKKTYWRKQILPSGTRKYGDKTLDFATINPACVKNFEKLGADQPVYYVFANPDNSHPAPGEEIERMEGTLHKVELADEGKLFGYFDLSASAKAIEAINKSGGRFGVSAKIAVNYERKDTGEKFDYVLTHVCGTAHPHIKGMGGWQTVELSESQQSEIDIDLSAETIEDKVVNDMPTTKADLLGLLGLKEEDLAALTEFKKAQEDIAKLNLGGEGGDNKTPVNAVLSEATQAAITLAETNASNALALAEKMQAESAVSNWSARKALLVRDGVPPAIIALAEGVMQSHKPLTIQLSDTEAIDGRDVIAKIMDECKGYVNLGEEEGSQFHKPDQSELDDMEAFAKEWGLSELFPTKNS